MDLSQEQAAVVTHEGPLLVVKAFAGAGKTTTLYEFVLRRPGKKILYLSFNRANIEHAKRKFAGMKNVECVTSHALARKFFSFDNKKIGDTSAFALQNNFDLSEDFAEAVLAGIDAFIHSGAAVLLREHIPTTIPEDNIDVFYLACGQVWSSMVNPSDMRTRISHDGYLKLADLENKKFFYDYILFDEAQDANPATVSWVLKQSGKKIFVGDEHQAIYSFRGSINALDNLPGADRLYLTESFRFGAGIAGYANLLLSQIKHSETLIVPAGRHPSSFTVDRSAGRLVLSRANYSLFDSAADCAIKGIPFGFVGEFNSYRFMEVLDVWRLHSNRRKEIVSAKIKEFRSYSHFNEYAEKHDKKDLLLLRNLMDKHGSNVSDLVWLISQTYLPDKLPDDAVVLSTAHKAKGSEHMSVELADDFMLDYGKGCALTKEATEEANILYVALTRSIQNLGIPKSVENFLGQLQRQKNSPQTTRAVYNG